MKSRLLQVLNVDDDPDDCQLFQEAVDELSFPVHVTMVHDGEQLLKLLKEKNRELPQAIFLDLNMPRKNGFECLSEIKENQDLKHISIIVVSTYFDDKIVNRLYDIGADYGFRKPADFRQLKELIYRSLTLILGLSAREAGNKLRPPRETFLIAVNS